eukprot:TRINITY_DN7419_c0_g1_i3.p1 TRINITY_DN7419_c0_g1~~TRINITY_DN7419_c0_g1_i3.p1  ORF type:complete len:284 (+),score=69.58 TRINITY_DN7419_c0_g1_i3:73-852(+)
MAGGGESAAAVLPLYVRRGEQTVAVDAPAEGSVADLERLVCEALQLDGHMSVKLSFAGAPLGRDTLLADSGLSPEAVVEVCTEGWRFVQYPIQGQVTDEEAPMCSVRYMDPCTESNAGDEEGVEDEDNVGGSSGEIAISECGQLATMGRSAEDTHVEVHPTVHGPGVAEIVFDLSTDDGNYHYIYCRAAGMRSMGHGVRQFGAGEHIVHLKPGRFEVTVPATEGSRRTVGINLPAEWRGKELIIGLYLFTDGTEVRIVR